MPSRTPPPPTDAELEILHVVWELGVATVRQVHEAISSRRPVAYTTTMTMLGLLVKKGHLRREEQGRAFVYRPAHSKSRVVGRMLDDFVARVFRGSARPLVLALVRDRKLSKRDLEEIARIADEEEPR
jgi:BlaI family transcriptional regulator, penicillinase repressor